MIPIKLKINGDEISLAEFKLSPSSVPSYQRFYRDFEGGCVVLWYKLGNFLIDVYTSKVKASYLVEVQYENGLSETYTLLPFQGIGFSSSTPKQVIAPDVKSVNSIYFADLLNKPIDVDYTEQTGSPRNYFFSYGLKDAMDLLSQEAEQYYHKFTEYQLKRPYQKPSLVMGYPASLDNPSTAESKQYGTLWPFDTHHMTVGRLCEAYIYTKNPRALDQAVRCLMTAIDTQDYYKKDQSVTFYGLAARVPGWFFNACADLFTAADLSELPSVVSDKITTIAKSHLQNILNHWKDDVWSPFANNNTTGGHYAVTAEVEKLPSADLKNYIDQKLLTPIMVSGVQKYQFVHQETYQIAVLAWGAQKLAAFIPEFKALAEKCVNWIDQYGVDPSNPNFFNVWYDRAHPVLPVQLSTPSHPQGTAAWVIPPLVRHYLETKVKLSSFKQAMVCAAQTKAWGYKPADAYQYLGPLATPVLKNDITDLIS